MAEANPSVTLTLSVFEAKLIYCLCESELRNKSRWVDLQGIGATIKAAIHAEAPEEFFNCFGYEPKDYRPCVHSPGYAG